MKVGLIDIDSKIPNLALMKISAYYQQKGHTWMTAPLYANQYDLIYASKIFDFSPMPILPDHAIVGGSGIDLTSKLDENIEHIYPDYGLYGCDYAIGYTSRGCNRKCPFCIVPKKEGRFKIVCDDIGEFWRGQERLILLDSAINTDDVHFGVISEQLISHNIQVDFNQGLDIRYLNDFQGHCLRRIHTFKQIHFAWDFIQIEKAVRRGIEILKRHKLVSRSMFYVLIGYNTTPEEDTYRVDVLRGLGVDPFVMPFDKFNQYQRDFARYVNHKAIFKSVKWGEYRA